MISYRPLRLAALLAMAPCLPLRAQIDDPRLLALSPQIEAGGLRVELKRFETEPVNPFNAAQGADTCLTIEAVERGMPGQAQWLFARRLVAYKDGRERVLWDDKMDEKPNFNSPSIGIGGQFGTGVRNEHFLFNLRDVPVALGEMRFEWDALAQPTARAVPTGDDKMLSLAELDKAALAGGVRLSRKIVLRREGEKIQMPAFPPRPRLRVFETVVEPLPEIDDQGNDTRVVLRLAYAGADPKAEFTALDGLSLSDEHKPDNRIPTSYHEEADREGEAPVYRLTASLKSADLKGIGRLRIAANISDGKAWPLRIMAFMDVPTKK